MRSRNFKALPIVQGNSKVSPGFLTSAVR